MSIISKDGSQIILIIFFEVKESGGPFVYCLVISEKRATLLNGGDVTTNHRRSTQGLFDSRQVAWDVEFLLELRLDSELAADSSDLLVLNESVHDHVN